MNINSSLQKTPIAVIGLSAIFADAKNIEEYWENIITAKDSIKDVPADRWKIEDYYDEDVFAPDKTYLNEEASCQNWISIRWNLVCLQIFWK